MEKGKALPKPVDRSMNEACFWDIIEKTKGRASSSAEQIELLIAELELFKQPKLENSIVCSRNGGALPLGGSMGGGGSGAGRLLG